MKRICPNCNVSELHWDSSEDAEDCGYVVAGTVSFYHCVNCGAEIEMLVPVENEYKKENEE